MFTQYRYNMNPPQQQLPVQSKQSFSSGFPMPGIPGRFNNFRLRCPGSGKYSVHKTRIRKGLDIVRRLQYIQNLPRIGIILNFLLLQLVDYIQSCRTNQVYNRTQGNVLLTFVGNDFQLHVQIQSTEKHFLCILLCLKSDLDI